MDLRIKHHTQKRLCCPELTTTICHACFGKCTVMGGCSCQCFCWFVSHLTKYTQTWHPICDNGNTLRATNISHQFVVGTQRVSLWNILCAPAPIHSLRLIRFSLGRTPNLQRRSKKTGVPCSAQQLDCKCSPHLPTSRLPHLPVSRNFCSHSNKHYFYLHGQDKLCNHDTMFRVQGQMARCVLVCLPLDFCLNDINGFY